MTPKQIEKAQIRLSDLYDSMLGSSVYDIICEIVDLELALEKKSNK